MYFTKYRYIYLAVMVVLACTAFVIKGPLYEAIVDISVSPPEYLRKTDFSWITVNEWFNSQVYIITSHAILKDAKTDFPEEKLKKIIRATRLGAADIIRISARAEDRPDALIKLVDELSAAYLNKLYELSGAGKPALPPEKKPATPGSANKIKQEMHAKILDTLYADRAKIKNEAREADERLKNYSNELKRVKALIEEYRDANRRIAEIDKELAPINEKLERLRAVYTDNWPEVASLKQKADMLKEGREDLLARAGRLKTYEGEKSKLESKIEVETATYRELQRDIGSLDEQLGEAVKAMTGEKVDVAENPRAGTVQESQKSAYGYVINPPSINYLPDLGQQLIFGLFAGTAAWLLIGLIAGKR